MSIIVYPIMVTEDNTTAKTGEDDLIFENATLKEEIVKLRLTNKNMANFIAIMTDRLDKLGRAMSIESANIFNMTNQLKGFEIQNNLDQQSKN